MQHIRRRCKNCQRTYTYCTYGNGPEYGTESGCSMEYCADCQKAIDAALAAIPRKYEWRWLEIRPTLGLFDALTETREKVEKARRESDLPVILPLVYSTYDNVDTYIRDGVEYRVEWNDPTPEEKHVLVKMEYSLADDCFTNNVWETDKGETYYHARPFKWEEKTIEVKPMAPPLGKLLYFDPIDCEWDLKVPKVEKRKPQHIRREYTYVYSGATVRRLLTDEENARGCKNGCPNVNPDDLYDFLEYKCAFVRYDDEDFETITGVRVK